MHYYTPCNLECKVHIASSKNAENLTDSSARNKTATKQWHTLVKIL